MDGNGRWAKKRGLPRAVGHQRGVEAVRRLVRSLEPTGLECLTLYAFSSENWKRSEDEVDDLMNLMRRFIKSDLPEFIANNVKLKIIGDWQSLAPDIVAMLEDALARVPHSAPAIQLYSLVVAGDGQQSVFLREAVWFEDAEDEVSELLLPIMVGSGLFDEQTEFAEIARDRDLVDSMIDQIPELLTALFLLCQAPEEKPALLKPRH